MGWINQYLFGICVPWLLMAVGIFYTIRLRAFWLRRPRALMRALLERRKAGGVSPFRALTLALAGTLGVGNIVGVSAAIYLGGFGAVFWMWISALCAMVLKYAEIVLAMRHRRYDRDGQPHGAAMYYIRDYMSAHGHRVLGGGLALLFALFFLLNAFVMGSVIQSRTVVDALEGVFGLPTLPVGCALALLVGIVIRRGTGGVAAFCERLVPWMTAGYLVLSLAVLIVRRDALPAALRAILVDAFSASSAAGGIGGFLLSRGVRYGTMRGLVSNEAGCGTAPTAHAVSACSSAAKQGVFGIVEVFVDTIVLCTVTALVVIVGYDEAAACGENFIMMTVTAYEATIGRFASYFMGLAVLCFGLGTVVCWAHYGRESVRYLYRRRGGERVFVWLYSASVLIGAVMESGAIWQATDFAVGGMTVINLIFLLLMSGEVKEETERYFQ